MVNILVIYINWSIRLRLLPFLLFLYTRVLVIEAYYAPITALLAVPTLASADLKRVTSRSKTRLALVRYT